MLDQSTATLATILRHKIELEAQIQKLIHALERRAKVHDLSKLGMEELPGFVRINSIARERKYGSPEYRASLAAERETIDHHTGSNSHHPEFHLLGLSEPDPADDEYGIRFDSAARKVALAQMPLLDLIEMVCDWHAAAATYGSDPVQLETQRQRFPFSAEQWWLIEKLSEFLTSAE